MEFPELDNKKLVVYGTGVTGMPVITYLYDHPQYHLLGCTSSSVVERGLLDELPIIIQSPEQWIQLEPDATVLIAAHEKHRSDIIRRCQSAGVQNILTVSDELIAASFAHEYGDLAPEQYEGKLKQWYKRATGMDLDLDNPKTFNEKIQWLKLYDSTPLKTRLADKYLVREWVADRIGEEYLIPLLGVWDSFDEIDFDTLPNQFVLKANHGCGWNVIVRNKMSFDKAAARQKFDLWMKLNYAFRAGLELQYRDISPKIIAEAYIENTDDLYDYKVFCFHGKAESVMFLADRERGLKMAFYDLNWNKLPFVYSYPMNNDAVPKQANLELLIHLSEQLAADFPYVRVDFYVLNDGSIRFGEMTFTPYSGACKWRPPEQDRIYGELIHLPKRG